MPATPAIPISPVTPTPPRRALLALAAAALLAAGCAVSLQPARMVLPPGLEAAAPMPFAGLGAGRSGRFTLDGQTVTFRRLGDALSVFDRLRLDRVAVEFERGGAQGRCDGRAAEATVGGVQAAVRPLTLTCRFTGAGGEAAAGELTLQERPVAGAGARLAREGQARFGAVVVEIRSEHALAGSPLPLSQPAGYRLAIAGPTPGHSPGHTPGQDAAALELTGGTPVLRLAPGLDGATREALILTALALGLLFEPAVTLG
jgi:hypothetical protein